MDVLERHNVVDAGDPGGRPIVFAHGYGCSQDMWRLVAPVFSADHRVILFDHVGAGRADRRAYDPSRHATLDGYAQDVVELLDALDLRDAVFVGHSVSSMIGVLAAAARPDRVGCLVMVCPSPRYLDDDDGYRGGFSEADMAELLELLDEDYQAWAATMAPTIMATPDRPELAAELEASFCYTDPDIAKQFARTTFLSDNREDLGEVSVPTLVIQSRHDAIAPMVVGEYVAEQIPDSELTVLETHGHCPNLSAPELTADAISTFLRQHSRATR